MKIRKLCRKDRVTLTNLILRFVDKTGREKLINMVPQPGDKKEDNKAVESELLQFAVSILTEMVRYINDDITPWFADLVEVSIEEFDNLPFDTEVDIINQLIDQKEFTDFFLKVSQVHKKTKDLVSQFQK